MKIESVWTFENITAKSASEDIDLETIIQGCVEIRNQINRINTIQNNFNETSSMITVDALAINGKSPMLKIMNDCNSETLENINEIESSLDNVIQKAYEEYNKLQSKYNDEAYNQYLLERKKRMNSQ